VEYGKGNYVVLSPDEISDAYPRTTQTIEIETFVDIHELPFVYLEKPYYTAPINKGEKVYALLREALRDTGKAAIGRVVIRSKQHLAVVLPCGPALVLNLLRWGGEIRSWEDLPLPREGRSAAGIRDAEMKMARQLIEDMSGHWSAQDFRDDFHKAVMKLVEAKAKAGETATVEPLEEAPEAQGADVIDLTELLRRSLRGGTKTASAGSHSPSPAPARKTAARKPAGERAVASSGTRKRASAKKAPAKKAPSRARRAA